VTAAPELVSARIEARLRQFQVTTAAPEMARRLAQGGLDAALAVVDDVLTLETEARRERRIGRLRQAAELPVAKTMGTFHLPRLPAPLADRSRPPSRSMSWRRSRRRIRPRTVASRRVTSTSLGGSRSGTKRCDPSGCSANTPSAISVWKRGLVFNADPQRWIAVIAPARPRIPSARARRCVKPSSARTNTPSTARQRR